MSHSEMMLILTRVRPVTPWTFSSTYTDIDVYGMILPSPCQEAMPIWNRDHCRRPPTLWSATLPILCSGQETNRAEVRRTS